jgi:hypothetical protein
MTSRSSGGITMVVNRPEDITVVAEAADGQDALI